MRCAVVFILVSFGCFAYEVDESHPEPKLVSQAQLSKLLANSQIVVALLFSLSLPGMELHHKDSVIKALQEFGTLAISNEPDALFVVVDVSLPENSQAPSIYQMTVNPTIVFAKNSRWHHYQGERTASTLLPLVKKHSQITGPKHITGDNAKKQYLEVDEYIPRVVAWAKPGTQFYSSYLELANCYSMVFNYGLVTDQSMAKSFGLKKEGSLIYSAPSLKSVEISDPPHTFDELSKLVHQTGKTRIIRMTKENSFKIWDATEIFFAYCEWDDGAKETQDLVKSLASDIKFGFILFVLVDSKEFPDFVETVFHPEDKSKGFVYYRSPSTLQSYPFEKGTSLKKVRTWLRRTANKAQRTPKKAKTDL